MSTREGFTCNHCGDEFVSQQHLDDHLAWVHDERKEKEYTPNHLFGCVVIALIVIAVAIWAWRALP